MRRIVKMDNKKTTTSDTNRNKFIPATETHFKYINTILADLSKKTRREQKKAYRFKRWLLDLDRNMRLHANIHPDMVRELYKHYKRVMYKYKGRESNRVVFDNQKNGG